MSLMCLICFIDRFCYKYCLQSQNEYLNERKTEKQRIVDFDGKCRPGLLYGDGVRMPKYLTIYYRSTGSLHENMRICQGNLGELSGKNCPTSIAINQLAVKITRRSLSFGCICINSSTCKPLTTSTSLVSCLSLFQEDIRKYLWWSLGMEK